jgi:hypothetical protein|tara:strand:+ start:6166 stop:6342 length:177 start_codon:yes stop_codon:yes gene_type:complete
MGRTFRNAKHIFEDDNDYYGDIKNKKKKQKNLRKIRTNKKTFEEIDTEDNDNYNYRHR